jgi:hypothetical protein
MALINTFRAAMQPMHLRPEQPLSSSHARKPPVFSWLMLQEKSHALSPFHVLDGITWLKKLSS